MKAGMLKIYIIFGFLLPPLAWSEGEPSSPFIPGTTLPRLWIPPVSTANPPSLLDASATPLRRERAVQAQDTAEEISNRQAMRAQVAEVRRNLERQFLGSILIMPETNPAIREYINVLMAAPEALVNQGTIPQNLSFVHNVGATGTAKSAIAQEFIKEMQRIGLLREERSRVEQGSPSRVMRLGLIERLSISDRELFANANTNSWSHVLERFRRSYAVVVFDEAAQFSSTTNAIEESFRNDMGAVLEHWKKEAAQRQPLIPAARPTRNQGETEEVFGTRILEWEIANTLRSRVFQSLSLEDQLKQMTREYAGRFRDLQTVQRMMPAFWSAASGGRYIESRDREAMDSFGEKVQAAELALTRFRAEHPQLPLLNDYDKLMSDIITTNQALENAAGSLREAMRENGTHATLLRDFSRIPPNAIEQWLEKNNHTTEANRLTSHSAIEEWIPRMINDITNDPNVTLTDMAGHETNPDNPSSATTERVRSLISGILERSQRQSETTINLRNAETTKIREHLESLQRSRDAFTTSRPNAVADTPNLIRDYEGLQNTYTEAILAAVRNSQVAKEAISQFFLGLSVQKLATLSPEYHRWLQDLYQGPDQAKLMEGHLRDLQRSQDTLLQFETMLKINPRATRETINRALAASGFVSEGVYLGNTMVVMLANHPSTEDKIRKLIEAVHDGRGVITGPDGSPSVASTPPNRANAQRVRWGRLREWYEKLLDQTAVREYLETVFPSFAQSPEHSNRLAFERRFGGPGGVIVSLPPNVAELGNHIAATVDSEFEKWRRQMLLENGVRVEGQIFVHENIIGAFIRDNMQAQLGPNAAIHEVKETMGKLLNELSLRVMEQHRGRSSTDPVRVNVLLQDEKVVGALRRLTLRTLPGNFETTATQNLLSHRVVRGNMTIPLAPGSFVAGDFHNHAPAAELVGYRQGGLSPYLAPANVSEPDRALPSSHAAYEESLATEEQQRVTAEAEATKRREAEETERKRIESEAQSRATQEKERIRTESIRRFADQLRAGRDLRSIYDSLNSEERDWYRNSLLNWVVNRTNGANPTQLLSWLNYDFEAGHNLDDFIKQHFDNLRPRMSRFQAEALLTLLTPEGTTSDITEKVKKGLVRRWVKDPARNIFRRACYHIRNLRSGGVPPELRNRLRD